MDILQFLLHRVAFFGLPSGEVQRIRAGVEAGQSWADVCGDIAASLEQLAEDCEAVGRRRSAAQAWRWTACALHATSFVLHLSPGEPELFAKAISLRASARAAYHRALRADATLADAVEIAVGEQTIHGYYRAGSTPDAHAV